MEIFRLTEISEDILIAFRKLIPQLSPDAQIPTKEDLEEIFKSENSFLFLARDKEIVGTLTLITYRIPTGLKVWIEDVVVDNKMRGKGIGEKLTRYAIDYAIKLGAKRIELTSKPSRIAANEMYKKMGFDKRETNVYRLIIDK